MTTTKIKLSDEDIVVLGWGGVVPNGLQIKIYVDKKTEFQKGIKIKKFILNSISMRKEIQESIASYERLNTEHQKKYDKSGDTSYLSTMNRNQDIIDELRVVLNTKYHSGDSQK